MEKLVTPLGVIRIYNDGIELEYNAIKLCNDSILFPDIDSRYKIEVEYKADNSSHLISCIIDKIDSKKTEVYSESGERLECQAFYQENIKLSIGIECDTGYFDTGERIGNYDYDSSYLNNGIGYSILPNTKSHTFLFGIAWINECNDENDLQTWFGADPTIMQIKKYSDTYN
ncbi:hypothetical protein SDC9_177120 [bioreactor metagenome]|uniref:Uncharacterized protein n=1 Tax=bioreactor metagenome TaxID=1076179 RepID=A0A645GRZ4_9ZZZZ